jgi:Flp pilus assembly protein TadG
MGERVNAVMSHLRPRAASFRRRDEGQAAFEFLLVLPLFVGFMLLLIDFAILMYAYVSVANAAREGARFAAANCAASTCTADLVKTRTREFSSGFLPTSNPTTTVTVHWDSATVNGSTFAASKRGSTVSVRVDRPHQFLFFGALAPSFPVTSCSAMRLERDDAGTGLPSGGGC